MKIKYNSITGDVEFEREPMSEERFYALCCLIGGGGFMFFMYALLTSVR